MIRIVSIINKILLNIIKLLESAILAHGREVLSAIRLYGSCPLPKRSRPGH